MNENNPYSTPDSAVAHVEVEMISDGPVLAGRGQRLVAVIIDTLIRIGIFFVIAVPTGIWAVLMQGKEPDTVTLIAVFLFGFISFIAINAYLLHHYGQTIGKRLLGIRIVDYDGGTQTGMWKIILARYIPVEVMAQIPIVGGLIGLVDALMIFGSERRCLHDHIAGTMVVKN